VCGYEHNTEILRSAQDDGLYLLYKTKFALVVGDGDGLVLVAGVGDLVDQEVGEVAAGDLVGGGGWGEDFGGAGGRGFGEDGWADDDVLQAAGEDF